MGGQVPPGACSSLLGFPASVAQLGSVLSRACSQLTGIGVLTCPCLPCSVFPSICALRQELSAAFGNVTRCKVGCVAVLTHLLHWLVTLDEFDRGPAVCAALHHGSAAALGKIKALTAMACLTCITCWSHTHCGICSERLLLLSAVTLGRGLPGSVCVSYENCLSCRSFGYLR